MNAASSPFRTSATPMTRVHAIIYAGITKFSHCQDLGGDTIAFFAAECTAQCTAETATEVNFEKDTCVNSLFWSSWLSKRTKVGNKRLSMFRQWSAVASLLSSASSSFVRGRVLVVKCPLVYSTTVHSSVKKEAILLQTDRTHRCYSPEYQVYFFVQTKFIFIRRILLTNKSFKYLTVKSEARSSLERLPIIFISRVFALLALGGPHLTGEFRGRSRPNFMCV